jgi:zinc protease
MKIYPRFLLVSLLWQFSLTVMAPGVAAVQEAPGVAVPAEARTIALDRLVPVSPDVRVGRFENGLTYYIRENREPANRAEIRLIVRVGATLEDEDQLGMAHFLEHMAFNGTENFEKGELFAYMESIGMRLGQGVNAGTSYDETTYRLTVPMDDPTHLETAVRIVRDWADGLTLDSEEIDRERGVVIEEWRAGRECRLEYGISRPRFSCGGRGTPNAMSSGRSRTFRPSSMRHSAASTRTGTDPT